MAFASSAFTINIEQEVELAAPILPLLRDAAAATLHHLGVDQSAALTILLADDSTLHVLNQQFLGEDRPTDVLSFPAGEPLPGMNDLAGYLGDLALAVPYATRQAQAKGHEPAAELQLLVVHGVLHLLGYDHATREERAVMWRIQAGILAQLGLAAVAPAGEEEEAGA
jgi:probable rRNA maturation factor